MPAGHWCRPSASLHSSLAPLLHCARYAGSPVQVARRVFMVGEDREGVSKVGPWCCGKQCSLHLQGVCMSRLLMDDYATPAYLVIS
jgi:hypothetical protein